MWVKIKNKNDKSGIWWHFKYAFSSNLGQVNKINHLNKNKMKIKVLKSSFLSYLFIILSYPILSNIFFVLILSKS